MPHHWLRAPTDRGVNTQTTLKVEEPSYDLTGSFRAAAELAGCSHHTVAAHVARRDAGAVPDRAEPRPQLIEPFLPKVEEWGERARGKSRGDRAHEKLLARGTPARSGPPGARSRG
jgi:hypothetical protein